MAGVSQNHSSVLLDCTLRDGGYYNDWDFSHSLITTYVKAMAAARIPVVEMGFRLLEPTGYAGPTAHTTDSFLRDLDIPDDVVVGVMLNAKDLVTYREGSAAAVGKLFKSSADSPVQLVRIAATWAELDRLRPAVDQLVELGYLVGVNLMQVHARTQDELKAFGAWCSGSQVEVAYFADSFGGLYPSEIAPIVDAIAAGFDGQIGCHLHDNMALGMANALAAIDAGVTWIDATIRGMGRGPGNPRTEYLAVEMHRRGLVDVDVQALVDIVTDDFAALQGQYGWGTNLFYLMSAASGVHPTFVQTMLGDARYDAADIVATIDELGRSGGASFSMESVTKASTVAVNAPTGTWNASGWCKSREVLIVGPGQSVIERRSDIERYIRLNKPLVLNLNLTPLIDESLIDFYVACNPMRARLDMRNTDGDSSPVIAPNTVGSCITQCQPERNIYDYGFEVVQGTMAIEDFGCKVPFGVVTGYALAVVAQGEAKEISIVGLDGFYPVDPRQLQMIEIFDRFSSINGTPVVRSLTPTTYPVLAGSLYAPR